MTLLYNDTIMTLKIIGGEIMETRLTLRIDSKLAKLIEDEKRRSGMSMNQIITKACEKLIDDIRNQNRGR